MKLTLFTGHLDLVHTEVHTAFAETQPAGKPLEDTLLVDPVSRVLGMHLRFVLHPNTAEQLETPIAAVAVAAFDLVGAEVYPSQTVVEGSQNTVAEESRDIAVGKFQHIAAAVLENIVKAFCQDLADIVPASETVDLGWKMIAEPGSSHGFVVDHIVERVAGCAVDVGR